MIDRIIKFAGSLILALALAACASEGPGDEGRGTESRPTPPPPPPPFIAPTTGQFCVINKMNVGITISEPQIKSILTPMWQEDLESVEVQGDDIVPVRKCYPYAELSQKSGLSDTAIVWLLVSWGSFDMGGPDAPGKFGQNTFKYAELCRNVDIKARSTIVVEYEGGLRNDDTPDPKNVTCTRYNADYSERTEEYRPTGANWEGRPRCHERYSETSQWGAAFAHWTSGECYRCPAGFARTVWDLNGSTACEKGGVLGIGSEHARINYAGPECGTPKPGRYNFRNGVADQCYSCPTGWNNPSFGHVSFDLTESDACWPPGWPY